MNAETSRQPEPMVHVWPMPCQMKPNQALEYFEKHVKPKIYTFDKWKYHPERGQMVTW